MSKRLLSIIGLLIVVIVAGAVVMLHMSKNTASTSAKQANAPASSSTVVLTKTSTTFGQYLTDPSGKALYIYSKDTKGVSNCTGECLTQWPAYLASGSTTGLPTGVGTIKRTDNGKTQYTYNGMPLYFFVGDSAGQVTGNGEDGFTLAKPSNSQSAAAPATTPAVTPAATPAATPTPASIYAPNSTPAPVTTPAATPTPAASSGTGW
jgi:predicted lipoprotein with Yx(FWY)xxD motif